MEVKITNMSLNGKKYIVTGGSRGLGLAIVQALAEAGATVVSAQQRTAAESESCMHFDFFLVVVAPTTPTCQPALQSTLSELQTCMRS